MSYESSKLHDRTATHERQIEDEAGRHIEFLDNEAATIINRPIGSRVISETDQIEDYLTMRYSPEVLGQRYAELTQKMGPARGTIAYVDWIERMEKKLGRRL